MGTISDMQALGPQLAELAMESADQRSFRREWLGLVAAKLPSDSADACSSHDGITYATHTVHADGLPFEQGVAAYTAEIEMQELSLLMRGATVMDDRVFSAHRRDELRAYRELLIPRGVVRTAMRCWVRAGRVFFLFFNKHRGAEPFCDDDLRALDAVLPVIALGEALHAEQTKATQKAIADLSGVTRAERKVVMLAQRGLTNAEISSLTGSRPATVRNQLYSAYRKLGVKNRTELAFLLSGLDPRIALREPNSAVAKLLQTEGSACLVTRPTPG